MKATDLMVGDWVMYKDDPHYYNNEIIAAALGQVAKEYGYKED